MSGQSHSAMLDRSYSRPRRIVTISNERGTNVTIRVLDDIAVDHNWPGDFRATNRVCLDTANWSYVSIDHRSLGAFSYIAPRTTTGYLGNVASERYGEVDFSCNGDDVALSGAAIPRNTYDFPESTEVDLSEYYFSKSRIIYGLLTLAALAGVLFRPIAFGSQLLVVENLSTLPTIPVLILLAWSDNRLLHRILVPLCFLTICVDTLVISYFIE